ncbi:glycosyltransferase family 4 protein [Brevundimonas sp.]|uniref:glycosyltransferase family 4 protein n=1 Tax=Brevundimonas sp. TaxID=1871086 RepID=UPI00262BF235|nr:glycosyltransferase family 4 protein [Brevundimonas sp.]
MTARRRLLFVGPLPDPVTGQSLACKVLLDDLRHDHDVDVIDLNRDFSSKGKGVLGHVRRVLGNVARMRALRQGADVIYYNNVESLAGNVKDLAFYLAMFDRMDRAVVHLHGGAGMREIMAGKYPLLAGLNRFFLRRAAAMVLLGPRLVDIYAPHLEADRIKTAANFAEDRWFADDAAIRAKFADMPPIRLLFLSNHLPGKGHLELAQAFLRLEPELRARFRLDFAGGFDEPAAQSAFLDLIAPMPEARWHGVVRGEAKQELLDAAHVFCLPTYYPYEGQPISILEAYAAGAAVITTDHSGIFDTFADKVNGWAVEKRSVDSLASRLRAIAADPSVLEPFGLTNADAARATYRVEHFVARMRTILSEAVPPR